MRPPLGPLPHKPCRVLLQAEGTHPVIRLSAHQCFPPTAWFHDFFPPDVQGIVPIDIGEDGRDRPAWRRPSLGRDALTLRVQNPCLQPCASPVEKGPVVDAHAHPVPEPWLVHMRDEALDIRFYAGAIPSVWEGAGEVTDRLQRPPSSAIAVTAIEKVLRVDCRSQLRAGQWPEFVCQRGTA